MLNKLFVILITVFSFSSLGNAGQQTGDITDIRVTSMDVSSHHTHVQLSGTYIPTPSPACSTITEGYYWAINTDTEYGKAMLSTILAAQASGRQVTLWGKGECYIDDSTMEKVFQVGLK